MPKISVIIPVYNTAKYLAECLDSVIAQTMTDIEIVCINDGSTDDSLKILRKYAKQDSRIRVINQKNSGVIAARNNGVAHATADLIYPLDSDDKIAPDTLQELYNAFINNRGDVITSRIMKFGTARGEMVLPKPNKLNFCRQNCSVNAALFRKSDFIAAGGYDAAYKIALEDYDLWLNFVYRQNLRFYRVEKPLFFYRIKNKYESRNKQNDNQHDDIIKTFYIKYPKMKLYFILYKWHNRFKRFGKLFFNKEHHKIKLFGIPIKTIRNEQPTCIWFDGDYNFGDQLNPALFQHFGIDIKNESWRNTDMVAIGSLMEIFFSNNRHKIVKSPVVVWGTGFIKAPSQHKKYLKRRLDVRAVRGYYTLHRLEQFRDVKISPNVVVGDPGLLAGLLLNGKMPKKKYKLGIIPHYVDKDNPLLNKIKVKNSVVLDIATEPTEFMKQIAECENIISSAMHGLIAADSLGIPNIRMVLSNKIVGGNYKYDDYYSAFGIKKHNVINLTRKSFTDADLKKLRAMYKITPEQVRKKQQELLDSFPYKK